MVNDIVEQDRVIIPNCVGGKCRRGGGFLSQALQYESNLDKGERHLEHVKSKEK